ncbi:peptide deformylase [Xanthocytophaga agilis]|uniref:Peptide deformylase n=1 Tax=Xanthocytophaga agilis TaxID=3048010 RepID=A0AAE3UD60_9BACT|nr:peptide deformylase [Xanthocytophaga agilis]MDJ1500865.1 peptide deformylase [Xanthocytophaga agilis]
MKSDQVLLLGDPRLHEVSTLVAQEELAGLTPVIQDLHDILFEFKARFAHYGAFRAIAAPQIGVMKRLIYMYIDKPVVFINPVLTNLSAEMIELWDDCMCFPNLLVKLQRHKSCTIEYRDEHWQLQSLSLTDSLSELLQHEYDHLNGILATQLAIDAHSFRWRK